MGREWRGGCRGQRAGTWYRGNPFYKDINDQMKKILQAHEKKTTPPFWCWKRKLRIIFMFIMFIHVLFMYYPVYENMNLYPFKTWKIHSKRELKLSAYSKCGKKNTYQQHPANPHLTPPLLSPPPCHWHITMPAYPASAGCTLPMLAGCLWHEGFDWAFYKASANWALLHCWSTFSTGNQMSTRQENKRNCFI